jgi:hypothetical protein
MTTAPAAAPLPKPQASDFDRIFTLIATNKLPVPNWQEMDLALGVGHIAAAGLMVDSGVCWATVPEIDQGKGNYVRFFLNKPYGQFDGTGMAMVFSAAGVGRIGRFAICKHVRVPGRDANPRRGWNPAHCEKCGLDLSTDSGD